jgi:hypothetical protein
MNSKLKAGLKVGLGFAELIFPAVKTVETAANGLKTLKGADKQQAAVNLILASAAAAEQISGKEVLSPEADALLRVAIDANVAFMNQVKADHAAAGVVVSGATTGE